MKVFALVLSLFTGSAFACSCSEWGTARQMLRDYDVAFVGSYISSVIGGTTPDGDPMVTTNMAVLKGFKGTTSSKIVVRSTPGDGANCGTNFITGQKYLVFSYKYRGRNYTDGCSYDVMQNTREQRSFLRALEIASRSL
jgi:hypothetical protein